MRLLHSLIFFAFGFYSSTSCSFNSKKGDKLNIKTDYVEWDQTCRDKAAELGSIEAWCFTSVSNGGYEDGGQIFVYANANHTSARIDSVARGSSRKFEGEFNYDKMISTTKVMAGAEWATLKKTLDDVPTLNDIETNSFDGIQSTLTYLNKKNGDKLKEAHRVEMNNPEQDKVKAKKHLEIIAALEKAVK